MFLDPFHGDVESANKAYIACGKVAMFWGPVELAVELIVVMLRNRQKAPTRSGAFIDFPVSFERKKREIKDRLKDDKALFGDIREPVSRLLRERQISTPGARSSVTAIAKAST